MSKRVFFFLWTGLIFFEICISSCIGVEEFEFLTQLTNVRDTTDNKQALMEENQQYESTYRNPNALRENYANQEVGTRDKRNVSAEKGTDSTAVIQNMEMEPPLISDDMLDVLEEYFVNKRTPPTRKNDLDMGFKSRPGFRSWGGKRTKFRTWGGKRSAPDSWSIEERNFNNWGGKRRTKSSPEDLASNARMFMEGKVPPDGTMTWNKVKRFASWGGKRGLYLASPTLRAELDQNRDFGTWRGKRLIREDYPIEKREREFPMPYEQKDDEMDNEISKKDQFQSWGGKREGSSQRTFGAWGGKRKFSNWAGKRRVRVEEIPPQEKPWQKNFFDSYFNPTFPWLRTNRHVDKRNEFWDSPATNNVLETAGFTSWKGRR